MEHELLRLLSGRQGHFLLESGHHGELWLQLESLFLNPGRTQPFIAELVARLSDLQIDFVCGPLIEGAFVALGVASLMRTRFLYTERFAKASEEGLFPAAYRVPDSMRGEVSGKRVAIVNDVINAGSAVRATFADLKECGASIVAIGALLVLGSSAAAFVASQGVALTSLVSLPNSLWNPSDCPLCRAGAPLEDVAGFTSSLRAPQT
jgi:orotate phosphoribosyltransferase